MTSCSLSTPSPKTTPIPPSLFWLTLWVPSLSPMQCRVFRRSLTERFYAPPCCEWSVEQSRPIGNIHYLSRWLTGLRILHDILEWEVCTHQDSSKKSPPIISTSTSILRTKSNSRNGLTCAWSTPTSSLHAWPMTGFITVFVLNDDLPNDISLFTRIPWFWGEYMNASKRVVWALSEHDSTVARNTITWFTIERCECWSKSLPLVRCS